MNMNTTVLTPTEAVVLEEVVRYPMVRTTAWSAESSRPTAKRRYAREFHDQLCGYGTAPQRSPPHGAVGQH